jgi:hypothetical protein
MHHAQIHASLYSGEANPGTNEQDFTELVDHMRVINEHREAAGRMGEPFEFVVGMGATPDKIQRVQELGATTVTVGPSSAGLRGTKDEFIDWIKRFADEVMTKV